MSFIKLVTTQSDDEDEKKLFTANINEELPNNKLIDQLRNGLTLYVQRMQMRECFYATIQKFKPHNKWTPPARECSSFTFCATNNTAYLIGGLNYDVSHEVASL